MSLAPISSVSSTPSIPEPKAAPIQPPASASVPPADTVKISPAAHQASADVDHDGDSH